MTDANDEDLLAEQLRYYRRRAPEYDEWWERRGRYDRGAEHNRHWAAEIGEVREVFDSLPFDGVEVVELAPGTGYWTELLAIRAARVTAVDGSPEMVALNRARLGAASDRVEYAVEDLFAWRPDRTWDGMVFCFWISHVPRARLEPFFITCRRALREGAPIFFLDGRAVPETTAADHTLPEGGGEIMERRLNDGQRFRIVKNFHTIDELEALGAATGFDLRVGETGTFFQYGVGRAV